MEKAHFKEKLHPIPNELLNCLPLATAQDCVTTCFGSLLYLHHHKSKQVTTCRNDNVCMYANTINQH